MQEYTVKLYVEIGGDLMRNKGNVQKCSRLKRKVLVVISIMLYALILPLNQNKVSAAVDKLDEKIKLIEVEIENNMKVHNIPGMAFALVDDNGILYSNGFGVVDFRDDSVKIDENTNFNLGSLSKVFTSVAIMQLQEQGIVSLDDPVVEHLPWFSTKNAQLSNQIKIRHLLNHSSGLPGRLNVHEISSLDRQEIIIEVEKKLSDVKLVGQPGEIFEYTNMNTDLLQLVIEEVTGGKFTEYMEKNILIPLEMDRTGYFTFRDSHLSNTAIGHRYHWGDIKPFKEELVYATSSSAGLSSNVMDLAKFMTFLLNEGEGPASPVIHSTSVREMFQANKYGVGFNWFVFPHNIFMDGGLPGFTSTMVLASDNSFGLVLLANSKQDITVHSGFNLFRIVEGGTPTALLASDYAKVDPDSKLILIITIIIGLLLTYIVVSNSLSILKGRQRLSVRKPGTKKIGVLTLILLLYVGVMYYIHIYLPYEIGVPTLSHFKMEPDFLDGIYLLTIVFSSLSLALCLKILFTQKNSDINL